MKRDFKEFFKDYGMALVIAIVVVFGMWAASGVIFLITGAFSFTIPNLIPLIICAYCGITLNK